MIETALILAALAAYRLLLAACNTGKPGGLRDRIGGLMSGRVRPQLSGGPGNTTTPR